MTEAHQVDVIVAIHEVLLHNGSLQARGSSQPGGAVLVEFGAHRRFQGWVESGVFHEIWRQALLDYLRWGTTETDQRPAGAINAPWASPGSGRTSTDGAKTGKSSVLT